ncbi:MAG TPA: hypothetical protein VG818_02480, partial [Gemmatimonadaceae bacterium]|nr:hypothetical protein [Gemmatimonadaceae bacterium]
ARLVEIYVLMGTLCGLQRDDGGFVFFEQALQLAAITDASPLLHARIFSEYGSFKEHVGTAEEAEGYLERARRIFASLGAGDEARRVEHKLVKLAG